MRKLELSISLRRVEAKEWVLRAARKARAGIGEAWWRLAVALHLKHPPKRGLRSRVLHR